MASTTCPGCGANYRVPESAAGQAVRCKRCGQSFRLAPAAQAPSAEDAPLRLSHIELQAAAPPQAATPDADIDAAARLLSNPTRLRDDAGVLPVSAGLRGYFSSLLQSLLFPLRLGDLLTFLFLWAIMIFFLFVQFAARFSFFGVAGVVIVGGWYMAYLLNVVSSGTAGDAELPPLSVSSDSRWVGVLAPLMRYFMSWLAALLPFFVGVTYLWALDVLDGRTAWFLVGMALGGAFEAFLDPSLPLGATPAVLLIAALLLHPILLLVVAIGGVAPLARLDLIGFTVARTLGSYLIMAAIVLALRLGPVLLAAQIPSSTPFEAGFGLAILLVGLGLYCELIAMRAIGLHYHHFKGQYAWSWG